MNLCRCCQLEMVKIFKWVEQHQLLLWTRNLYMIWCWGKYLRAFSFFNIVFYTILDMYQHYDKRHTTFRYVQHSFRKNCAFPFLLGRAFPSCSHYILLTSLTIWLQNSNLEKVTKYCMARYTMEKTNKIYDQRTTEGLSGLEIPFLLASNSKNNVPAQHNMLSLVVCPFWIESWNPQNRKRPK